MKLQKGLREFIALLNSAKVKYVIAGGYAVGFHGYPRYTGDIDVFIEASPENAARMEAVLADFGFQSDDLKADVFVEPDRIIQLGLPPNRIDVITSITGVTFQEAWASRTAAVIDGLSVQFMCKPLLLRNKQAAGRPKDLADIDALTHDRP